MTGSSTGSQADGPSGDDDQHGTPTEQHGDPLLASAQGHDEGDGSRQGPPREQSPEEPAGD